jgi:DNA-binding NarL/FixJ family response regulator
VVLYILLKIAAMQPVTVAIADADHDRRLIYEQFLRDVPEVALLANGASSGNPVIHNRRAKPRNNITVIEEEVARAKRLLPRVLLVHSSLCPDENYSILRLLNRDCPSTYVVLVGDELANEELIIKALESGARGYVSHETVNQNLAKLASAIDRGEAWVSRKILGKIVNRIHGYETH